MTTELNKGEKAEEILRDYFLELGYFVIRGVPYKYNQFDVTDVDLWLYSQHSLITRERINVDIKNKKSPQAFERIFWTKGLQQVLGLDKCIVATTDTKKEVKDFGAKNDVLVLDGNFMQNLTKQGRIFQDRLNEEDILNILDQDGAGKLGGDWKGRLLCSKARILNKLDFNGCNEFLKEIRYLMEQSIEKAHNSQGAIRLLYITTSLLLINLDYIIKDSVHLEQDSRMKLLTEGFRYGQRGKARAEDVTNAAIKLASSVIANSSIKTTLTNAVFNQFNEIPTEILADFFSKKSNIKSLVNNAKSFESLGYSKEIVYPSNLPVNLQSIIGLLADFLRIERKSILSL
jgi:hypothetical protein